MDYSVIGKKIKELRKAIGITQGELAEGICTQALISRIEKGDIYPSATVLYRISQRLGVDVNYFFEIGSTERHDYIKDVERQFHTYRFNLQYEDMIKLIKKEEQNPLFTTNKENKQLLEWNKAIYVSEVEGDKEKAIGMVRAAIKLTEDPKRAMTEREMRLQITLGDMMALLEKYEEALKVYGKALEVAKHNPYLQDKSIKTRIYYHTARVITRLGDYDQSIEYCRRGLKWTISEERLYGIAQLYYQIGYNFELKREYDTALTYYQKGRNYFHIQKNTRFVAFIDQKMEDVHGLQSRR
ncbi:helix-turn-helix transcriptional regulator [Rossellomorea marisflavi]|uniref:Helix-turn-helix transcriptional regulator n=1 Tax=Rossellomorea marisflavi TaxID=189381 RepID=A0A5D4S4P7_9BACI|nr:helix-turn-helix domain-containing protein [Rossellomorea marisflavi]TYS57158.1 helix-turn-helix transcriptional regulator [Rossellomorea marisflavi]